MLFLFLTGILTGKSRHEDEELWRDFLSGDKEAISDIFLKYYGDLYRYGFKINPCDEAVRDSIQDLFFRLWKKRDILEDVVYVKKYLIVSLRRILIHQLRQYDSREKRNREYSDLLYQNISGIDEMIIHSEIVKEKQNALNESLLELTERQQEVVFLKFYEGYSNKEISEMTGLSYQRVCNITHEALAKLRQTVS